MKHLPFLIGIALVAIASTSWAQTQSTVLTPSQDNTLFQSATGTISSGLGPRGFVGANSGGNVRRYLVQFDVAGSLPAGSIITSATLGFTTLSLSPGGGPNYSQQVMHVNQAWGEGTSNAGMSGNGAPATPGDATWIHAVNPGALWTTPGGDFDPTTLANYNLVSVGSAAFGTSWMAADVQVWLDNPATNFGWMLKSDTENPSTAVALASRESGTPPTLTIEYILPSGTITTFCDPADLNSTGFPSVLSGSFGFGPGSGLHLEVAGGPPNQLGYFLVGTKSADPGVALGMGHLCLTQNVGRFNVAGTPSNSVGYFDAGGVLQNVVGTSFIGSGFDVPLIAPIMGNPTITAGDTWHYQVWHRETGGNSNLSNGLSVTF